MNGSDRPSIAAFVLLVMTWLALAGCLGSFFGTSMPANLREHGVAATATIVDIWDTGWSVNDEPVVGMHVQVQPPDGAAFQATIKRYVISRIAAAQPRPGQVIAVRFDPADPGIVAIDSGNGD
ncbi:MAG: hypothetical protein P4L92_12480 [Rudaea sp.]|nr:hypothetical protein [Rudaea sp.]